MIRLTLDNGDRWTLGASRVVDVFERAPKAETTLILLANPIPDERSIRINVRETPAEIRRQLASNED